MEKCKVLHIGSKSISVEYKLSNREIKNINDECDLGDSFDDRYKTQIRLYI